MCVRAFTVHACGSPPAPLIDSCQSGRGRLAAGGVWERRPLLSYTAPERAGPKMDAPLKKPGD